VGDAQTFKILDETTLQILHRSNVRLALSRKTFNHCALFIDPHPVVDSSPPACTASPPINPVVPTPAVHDNSNTPTSILAPTQPTPTSTLTTPTTPSMVHPDDAATSFDQPPQHRRKQRILTAKIASLSISLSILPLITITRRHARQKNVRHVLIHLVIMSVALVMTPMHMLSNLRLR